MVSVRLPESQLQRLECALERRRLAGTDDGTTHTRSRLLRVVITHGLDALDALELDGRRHRGKKAKSGKARVASGKKS